MRIAIITSGYRPSLDGTSVAVHERCRRLSAWGHDVLIVGPDYAPIGQHLPDWPRYLGEVFPRVHAISVPSSACFGIELERNPVARAFKMLQRHLDAFRPDVVHVDEPERLAYGYLRRPGLAYARAREIPAVAFYHTNYIDYGADFIPLPASAVRAIQRLVIPALAWVYNAYDATLVPAATTADKLATYGIRNIVAGRFNGVDVARFSAGTRGPGFFERRFGAPPLGDRVKLLFVGRLTPDKGWGFALKALPALAAQFPRGRLAVLVAGAGEMRDEIERSLRDRLDALHLLGPVQPEEMPQVYANADLHVSCSQKENAPLTAFEAAAAGIPIVAPRAGGFIDAVPAGDCGALYAPDDVEDFLRAIVPFVADAEMRKACGVRGRRFAVENDWDVTVRLWLDAIAAVRPRSGARPARLSPRA